MFCVGHATAQAISLPFKEANEIGSMNITAGADLELDLKRGAALFSIVIG